MYKRHESISDLILCILCYFIIFFSIFLISWIMLFLVDGKEKFWL